MRSVILFGGGDSGGLLITDQGVRPIPPFDPSIRQTLKSAAAMMNALTLTARDGAIKNKKAKLAASLANLAVEQVEEVVGELDGEHALVFQDDNGGFYCGSTGKPPIPLPWPPPVMPTLPQLMAAGLIEQDLLALLQAARAQKISYNDVFEDPSGIAKRVGVSISEKTASDLHLLAPSKVALLKDPTDKEVLDFFHKVLADGRYLQDWFARPAEVSRNLKVALSETAMERMVTGGAMSAFGLRSQARPVADIGISVCIVAAADVVIIAIVAITHKSVTDIVNDRSGIAKI